jgi:hypothetical protein
MGVLYEWDIETFDPTTDDILDHSHFEPSDSIRLRQALLDVPGTTTQRLALVRDVWRDGDLHDRAWAYVEAGELPETFDNGERVPKAIRRLFDRAVAEAVLTELADYEEWLDSCTTQPARAVLQEKEG